MRKKSLEFLKNMIVAPSPSGFEQPAMKIWREYVGQYAEKVWWDRHGNSFAVKNSDHPLRLMLAGHCDELGFIIKYIDENGYLYFATIGGHDFSMISGRRVVIHSKSGPVSGVTGKKAIHLMNADERKKVPEIQNLWIDIGASSEKEALERVEIGDPVTYDVVFQPLHGDIATSRAFDNQVGAFAVAETMRLLQKDNPDAAVYSVATVQEEIGLRGARTSAYEVDPQVGIAIDVTHATDHPEVDKRIVGKVELGQGPVITRGANANPVVSDLLVEAAKAEKIPYQMEAEPRGTGTDANAIQLSRAGVAAGLVSIPLRYMHTPSEVVSLKDVENAAALLAAFARRLKTEMTFLP